MENCDLRSYVYFHGTFFLIMKYFLFSLLFFLCAKGIAQERAVYDADFAIREMRDGWLVVRLPLFQKKIGTLDSLLRIETLSEKSRKKLVRERDRSVIERDIIQELYPITFDSAFTFSRYAFLATSDTEAFQKGLLQPHDSKGNPIDSFDRENYYFATLSGAVGKPFQFTTSDHKSIPYPFPNNIGKPGSVLIPILAPILPFWVASFALDESTKRRGYRHVVRLDRKLSTFYAKRWTQ